MANWNGISITAKGKNLMAKVETGLLPLNITKIKIGSGEIGDNNPEILNDLIEPKQMLGISHIEAQDNGMCKITSVLSNNNLEEGFFVRELGVFATDPDEGEILYAYTYDRMSDWLPPNGGSASVGEQFDIFIGISNTAQVTAVIDMSAVATQEYVERVIAEEIGKIKDFAPDVTFIKENMLWFDENGKLNVGGVEDNGYTD